MVQCQPCRHVTAKPHVVFGRMQTHRTKSLRSLQATFELWLVGVCLDIVQRFEAYTERAPAPSTSAAAKKDHDSDLFTAYLLKSLSDQEHK